MTLMALMILWPLALTCIQSFFLLQGSSEVGTIWYLSCTFFLGALASVRKIFNDLFVVSFIIYNFLVNSCDTTTNWRKNSSHLVTQFPLNFKVRGINHYSKRYQTLLSGHNIRLIYLINLSNGSVLFDLSHWLARFCPSTGSTMHAMDWSNVNPPGGERLQCVDVKLAWITNLMATIVLGENIWQYDGLRTLGVHVQMVNNIKVRRYWEDV